jgi:hypothetical protein
MTKKYTVPLNSGKEAIREILKHFTGSKQRIARTLVRRVWRIQDGHIVNVMADYTVPQDC